MTLDEPRRPDPDALLAEAVKAGRGRLKVFFGQSAIQGFLGRQRRQDVPGLIGIFDEVQLVVFQRQNQVIDDLRAAPFVGKVGIHHLKRDETTGPALVDQDG